MPDRITENDIISNDIDARFWFMKTRTVVLLSVTGVWTIVIVCIGLWSDDAWLEWPPLHSFRNVLLWSAFLIYVLLFFTSLRSIYRDSAARCTTKKLEPHDPRNLL